MACHLLNTKPQSEAMLVYCEMDPWEQISEKVETSWNKIQKFSYISEFQNVVCKIAAILFQPQCVTYSYMMPFQTARKGCDTPTYRSYHRKLRVVMMPTLSSLVAPQVTVPTVMTKLASSQISMFSDCKQVMVNNLVAIIKLQYDFWWHKLAWYNQHGKKYLICLDFLIAK